MRIIFKGMDHPSAVAKSLKKALAARGVAIGLRRCEEIFAKMTGYANWHELRRVCMTSVEASPFDEAAGETVALDRRKQYVEALLTFTPIERHVAVFLVDELHPTSRTKRNVAAAAPAIAKRGVGRADVKVGKFFTKRLGETLFVREVLEIYDDKKGRCVLWTDDIIAGTCTIGTFTRWAAAEVERPPTGWKRAESHLAAYLVTLLQSNPELREVLKHVPNYQASKAGALIRLSMRKPPAASVRSGGD